MVIMGSNNRPLDLIAIRNRKMEWLVLKDLFYQWLGVRDGKGKLINE